MSTRTIPEAVRLAALEDYTSGHPCAVVAARHGVSVATVGKWIMAAGVSRLRSGKPDTDPVAYEGRWVRRGLIWRGEIVTGSGGHVRVSHAAGRENRGAPAGAPTPAGANHTTTALRLDRGVMG